jgi:transcriptional regulator with XRE-family HTH domain
MEPSEPPGRTKAPTAIDQHVGRRVRTARMLASVSQEKLADAIGVTFQQVQKYEKGTNRISVSRLQQIASMLNVPISYFYEGDAAVARDDTFDLVTEMLTRPETVDLVHAFTRIEDERVRQSLLELARAAAGNPAAADIDAQIV